MNATAWLSQSAAMEWIRFFLQVPIKALFWFLLRNKHNKTNNESRVLLPFSSKGKKRKRRKNPLWVQEALWDFSVIFSSEQKCWQAKRWNYISYSCSGPQASGQERKCTIKCDLSYWREAEPSHSKKRRKEWKRNRGEKRGNNRERA